MNIRQAKEKDFSEIAHIMKKEFSQAPYNENATIEEIIYSISYYTTTATILVAEEHESIQGVLVYRVEQWWEGPVAVVIDLATIRQGEGIGSQLLETMEQEVIQQHDAIAVVLSTHRRAQALDFYKKQGYQTEETVNLRKDLTINGE